MHRKDMLALIDVYDTRMKMLLANIEYSRDYTVNISRLHVTIYIPGSFSCSPQVLLLDPKGHCVTNQREKWLSR